MEILKNLNNEELNLLILRGTPGSGKSSLADLISRFTGFVVCTADDFFMDEEGNYNYNVSKLGVAHKQCQEKCEAELKYGRSVIVANTNTKESELKAYLKLGEIYKAKVFSVIVENRHGNNNVHNVPIETLEAMRTRFSIKL